MRLSVKRQDLEAVFTPEPKSCRIFGSNAWLREPLPFVSQAFRQGLSESRDASQ